MTGGKSLDTEVCAEYVLQIKATGQNVNDVATCELTVTVGNMNDDP